MNSLKFNIIWFIVVCLSLLGLIFLARSAAAPAVEPPQLPVKNEIIKAVEAENILDPELEAWLDKLEYCESGGKSTAVNPKDLDGTPSYGAFQFKPGTLKHYGVKYGLVASNLETADYINLAFDPVLTRDIVRHMAYDEAVRWRGEFPGCTAKIGLPPKP